ncbi:CACTA en-spm transposon protein [Cucumis melo var. makuwa]|uniref:CACTA en-spm transposon protein n=1 Tax=Cucumis melo var. makuwa TaxID=1194695 RepID=A0A5A7TJG1_CUCMM|nr:CACTA en-spm transposon protein [Cucumis melo var. makuwa]
MIEEEEKPSSSNFSHSLAVIVPLSYRLSLPHIEEKEIEERCLKDETSRNIGTPRRSVQCRLLKLERYVAANGRIPMTIAPGTEKPISSYAIPFSQAIGVCVRKIFSIHCLKWADIDREYIEIVKADLQHLKKFGDDCHRHFKKYSDPEEARANPPNLLEQSWTNKATKQKQPYNHSSGSKSFLQRQHELTKQRGESVDCVELFRETHIRSGTFVLHVVEDVHNQVLELQSQPTPEGS